MPTVDKHCRSRHQRSKDSALSSLFWPLVLSSWEGIFLYVVPMYLFHFCQPKSQTNFQFPRRRPCTSASLAAPEGMRRDSLPRLAYLYSLFCLMSTAELFAQFFVVKSSLTLLLTSKLFFPKQIRTCVGLATT